MRHAVRRTSIALASALLPIVLLGCSAPSATTDAPATSAPAATAPAETAVEEAAPAALPAVPSDVSGMRGWFEAAYPEAPWLARIAKIEYVKGEVPDSGGFANAIVITSDLDFDTELPVAQEISAALGEAHPEWAEQYVIRFADGNNILAGDIFDPTP